MFVFDAEVKQAMIDSSRQIILCMDSSKIGKVFLAHLAH
jgi:DeoR/GlpR family transcriptional regulator of sugar metabolism